MYRINESKMYYDMADGQAIVINFVTGMYYGSNLLGSAVLDRLQAGVSPNSVLEALRGLPGCPEDMGEQLDAFIAELISREILIPGPTNAEECCLIGGEALEDGFFLTVDEFAEAQDLLLADPVHDVDASQGWPVLRED
ncbi:hypothetical protein [Papillibacter cinnamivorans]|uniref:Coenzyme PQQ synthesis protein D (PqqD) n=1 Tax=Papillibacter cinnamivorans DSM 12816 TaxID=1122930 RepID=A0A1W2C0K7_9FIRM|nr:hypothetical protein [Papillibacter cinnamivorans]SMC78626.1 hypothetical protein SAMN02745168_2487 [Papillibacter cinnamivorans DSM 12816]